MNLNLTSTSPEATRELGRQLGEILEAGDWIGLTGELGAGKTCFTQGLAIGLGVDPEVPVTSPTFIIHQSYPGRVTLHHLDLYRLSTEVELFEIGYQELIAGDGACVVEWCERIEESQPGRGVLGRLILTGETTRQIELSGIGKRGDEILSKLEALV